MDIGCWRQEEGYIIRTYGNERLLSYAEWTQLRKCMQSIDDGASEALCDGYIKVVDAKVEERNNKKVEKIDLVALGLLKPKPPLIRRA
jgi:hypothetical protein